MLKSASCIVGAVLLAGCATSADVRTTVDPQADLPRYRAFTFLESTPQTAGAVTDSAARRRIEALIAKQLGERGYQRAGAGQAADLGVHYSARIEQKQSVLHTGTPGPYSYSWGSSNFGGEDRMNYRAGTLFVDLVDLGGSKLLWRTRVSEVFSEGYSEENWKKLDRALGEAFKELPQRR